MSMRAFVTSSSLGFYFCFQFFKSVDLNKYPKRCLKAINLNLSWLWAWSKMNFLGLSVDLGAILFVKKSKLHQQKPSNRHFLYLSRCYFLQLVFFSIFERLFKKNILISISPFNLNASLPPFPSKLLGFRSKFTAAIFQVKRRCRRYFPVDIGFCGCFQPPLTLLYRRNFGQDFDRRNHCISEN